MVLDDGSSRFYQIDVFSGQIDVKGRHTSAVLSSLNSSIDQHVRPMGSREVMYSGSGQDLCFDMRLFEFQGSLNCNRRLLDCLNSGKPV